MSNDDATDRSAPDELEALRRERDLLAARLAHLEHRGGRRRRLRRGAVVLLVVLGSTSFTVAAVGVWVRRNVADTEVWVERSGPLVDDPAVRAALGRLISDHVIDLVDPESLFEDALPERGRLLAGPLSGAVEGFVRERVDRFLASDAFRALWVAANEQVHRRLVLVLRGDADNVLAGDGTLTVNLVPIVEEVLADVGASSPGLLGRRVDLPELSVEDLPDAAVARLGDALGVELDDDFGQVTVYDDGRLSALQDGIGRARRLLVPAAVVAVVGLAGALALSDRRRRTLLQALAGLAIGIALVRRLGIRSRAEVTGGIDDPLTAEAAGAVVDAFLEPLLAVTRTLLVGIAVLAAIAVLTGPYPQVVWLRARAAGGARRARPAVRALVARGAGDDDPALARIGSHRGELQVAGIVAGLLALVLLDLSFVGVLVLAVVVGAFELALRPPAPTEAGSP